MGKFIVPGILLTSLLLFGCIANQGATGNQGPSVPVSQIQTSAQPIKTGGNMVVENGDTVSVWYLGTLEDGKVFDTNIAEEAKKAGTFQSARPYTPLSFEAGAGQMIKGFDAGVLGMKEGESKALKILPKEAYGEIRPELIRQFPISDLQKAGIEPEVGQVLSTSSGAQGTITAINGSNVTVDFNHFLAGKTLIFKITVEKIVKANQGG